MSNEYWKLLQDPRWQRLRLEVFEAAGFACVECGAKHKTLHAHHKIYHKGFAPWEYETFELVCLCDECHERWHGLKDFVLQTFVKLSMGEIARVAGFAIGCVANTSPRARARVASDHALDGMSKATGIPVDDLRSVSAEDGSIDFTDIEPLKAKKKGRKK